MRPDARRSRCRRGSGRRSRSNSRIWSPSAATFRCGFCPRKAARPSTTARWPGNSVRPTYAWKTEKPVVPPVAFQFAYYPSRNRMRLLADVTGLPADAALSYLSAVIRRAGKGTPVKTVRFDHFTKGREEQSFDLPPLEGKYEIAVTAVGTPCAGRRDRQAVRADPLSLGEQPPRPQHKGLSSLYADRGRRPDRTDGSAFSPDERPGTVGSGDGERPTAAGWPHALSADAERPRHSGSPGSAPHGEASGESRRSRQEAFRPAA